MPARRLPRRLSALIPGNGGRLASHVPHYGPCTWFETLMTREGLLHKLFRVFCGPHRDIASIDLRSQLGYRPRRAVPDLVALTQPAEDRRHPSAPADPIYGSCVYEFGACRAARSGRNSLRMSCDIVRVHHRPAKREAAIRVGAESSAGLPLASWIGPPQSPQQAAHRLVDAHATWFARRRRVAAASAQNLL